MRRDQAGDGGAMFMRCRRRLGASKVAAMLPASRRYARSIGRIDDRHDDVVAFGERMRLRQMQLGERVLGRIALGWRRVIPCMANR